jgi:hypothetical protein
MMADLGNVSRGVRFSRTAAAFAVLITLALWSTPAAAQTSTTGIVLG